MANNSTLPAAGDVVRDIDKAGIKTQVMLLDLGGTGTESLATGQLPVQGILLTAGSLTNAAAATGTMTAVDVSKAASASFVVFNTAAATVWTGSPTVVFEQSYDSTSWAPLQVRRETDGEVGTQFTLTPLVANAAIVFDCAVESVLWLRCRVTVAQATASMSIVCVPGTMPFSPVISVANWQKSPTATQTNVAASATSVTLKAANGSRKALYIFNAGTSNLFVLLGATATATTAFTFMIPPNGFWEFPDDPIYTGVVAGIWSATGGSGANITELT